MELLASGRMAEVHEWGDGRVLKLDRAEWNGCAAHEASVLERVIAAGVAAPRPHGTVTVDDRLGVVLDRVDGPLLSEVIGAPGADVDALARTWTDLHNALNARTVDGLPDIVTSVVSGIDASGLDAALRAELVRLVTDLDDGRRHLCHFDLHPANVIVGVHGWVVIDWLSASAGPPVADFARSLLLDPPGKASARARFMRAVLDEGLRERVVARDALDAWIRVLAAARISEGFAGDYAGFLAALASAAHRIDD